MKGLVPQRAIDRGLLDRGHHARIMIGIMAIMLFLTVLSAALGLGVTRAVGDLDRGFAGKLVVQLVEPDARVRDARAQALVARLNAMPGVQRVVEADRERLAALLRPWLGDSGLDPDLPMPVLIDVEVPADRVSAAIAAARSVAPDVRVDRSAAWLAPVRRFLATLGAVAIGLVLVIAAAAAGVVLLVTRAGLDTHRDTIEVLHMLGSTDHQIARLFQRRIAIDTLLGGAAGAGAALALVALLQARLAQIGFGVLGGAGLGAADWGVLALLPAAFALLATAAARMAVLRALARQL
ncbi:cell division protein FtsX [Sphingomonas pokkalii]|uniref:Permease n=1 Tax=Sphingomonas pokkalii TaxID=2175090 RepID=A0A2U0SAV6_9SPHN|nr:FtsX-like permease family protein [Sphingomonas pokkalii]PVX28459.1 permease [Sphingomonas pokkalii]